MQLTDSSGEFKKNYLYDAFGVEDDEDKNDTNPFRFCGEFYDKETDTIYLRARYYDPANSRMLSEDAHWNVSNMIYGDNPVKWNHREKGENDLLGLNLYTYKPDLAAITQSGNLYSYAINNPVMYQDPTGALVWPGEIHNAVSDHILWSQGLNNGRWLTPNKFVSYGGLSFGFADLYDSNTGEVWEIKPDKAKYHTSGPIQLQKYIDNLNGAKHGNSLGSGTFYYFTFGKIAMIVPQVYRVSFYSNESGMIYYNYDEIFGEGAAAAIALMLAAIATGTYNGNSIPIPGV